MSNEHKIFGVVTIVFIIAMFLGWNYNRSDEVLIRSGKCREIRFSELTNACFDSKKIKFLEFCEGNYCGPHSSGWASCNLAPIGSKAKKLCDKYQ